MGPVVAGAAVREQRLAALRSANVSRAAQRAVKAELRSGAVGVLGALDDPRAARLTVAALLLAVHGVGDRKARRVLLLARVSPTRRAGELTVDERSRLVLAVEYVGGVLVRPERAA